MTRRGRRVTQLADIAGATVLAIGGRAGAYPPSDPPLDLSHLEFTPALPDGAAPPPAATTRAAAPQPAKIDRTQLDRAITEQLDVIHSEEVSNGANAKDLAPEL